MFAFWRTGGRQSCYQKTVIHSVRVMVWLLPFYLTLSIPGDACEDCTWYSPMMVIPPELREAWPVAAFWYIYFVVDGNMNMGDFLFYGITSTMGSVFIWFGWAVLLSIVRAINGDGHNFLDLSPESSETEINME